MIDPIWFNGEIVPMAQAHVGVEDRGFQFADGVYEVMRLYQGVPFALEAHVARLVQSSEGIGMSIPLPPQVLADEIDRLIAAGSVRDGMLYLQLTRGMSPRSLIADSAVRPTFLFYARSAPPPAEPGAGEGVKLLALPDERWKRCWIKSIALLPNVLAKHEATRAGADEAVFVENGIVSECASANLFAVIGPKLLTHPIGSKVLPGITRALIIDIATQMGLEVDERPLREAECITAAELFITSTMREVSWVARWNDRYIGQARCGPVTMALHQKLRERMVQSIQVKA